MSALNYVWYQYRWQRLAAKVFDADGEDGLVRFWDCFHGTDRLARERGHGGVARPAAAGRGERDPRTGSATVAMSPAPSDDRGRGRVVFGVRQVPTRPLL